MPRALRIVTDDVSWRFLEKGHGRDAVVFLHGWMSGSGAWQAVIERLNGSYRMLAPDLPGFGGTIPARGFDFSVPAYASALVALLRRLAVDHATVVGWSFGGAVAMWLAAHEPRTVTRLVLINSAGGSPDMQLGHRIGGHRLLGAALSRMPRLLWDYLIRRAASDSRGSLAHLPGWFVEYHRQIVAGRQCRRAAYRVMRSLVKLRREGRQALIDSVVRNIHQPTLIVWGEQDRGMPIEQAVRLQRSISNARLVVLPDCAHCPLVEAPDALVTALNHFLHVSCLTAASPSTASMAEGSLRPARQDG